MPTNDDMTTPLTRHDLEEVLDQRLANYSTRTERRADLAEVRAELAELRVELANHPTHANLDAVLDRRFALQRAEIADDTRVTMTVLLEDAFKRFRVIDDQYRDLPARVQKLEAVVFTPSPRGRRKRSG
jgi:ribosomal protein L29